MRISHPNSPEIVQTRYRAKPQSIMFVGYTAAFELHNLL